MKFHTSYDSNSLQELFPLSHEKIVIILEKMCSHNNLNSLVNFHTEFLYGRRLDKDILYDLTLFARVIHLVNWSLLINMLACINLTGRYGMSTYEHVSTSKLLSLKSIGFRRTNHSMLYR